MAISTVGSGFSLGKQNTTTDEEETLCHVTGCFVINVKCGDTDLKTMEIMFEASKAETPDTVSVIISKYYVI